jgi:hypothetical protein
MVKSMNAMGVGGDLKRWLAMNLYSTIHWGRQFSMSVNVWSAAGMQEESTMDEK